MVLVVCENAISLVQDLNTYIYKAKWLEHWTNECLIQSLVTKNIIDLQWKITLKTILKGEMETDGIEWIKRKKKDLHHFGSKNTIL